LSDDVDSNSNSSGADYKFRFRQTPDLKLGDFGDIKEEEEDYEKEFLPHFATSKIILPEVIEPCQETISVTAEVIKETQLEENEDSDDDSFLDDDDGIGLGSTRKKTKHINIGTMHLSFGVKYEDIEQRLDRDKKNETDKLNLAVEALTKEIDDTRLSLK